MKEIKEEKGLESVVNMDFYTKEGQQEITEVAAIINSIDDGLSLEQLKKLYVFMDCHQFVWFDMIAEKIKRMEEFQAQLMKED